MKFILHPNSENPEWPTEPDPADLADAIERARKAKDPKRALREAPAVALQVTRDRVAAEHRRRAGGCRSDNLDWLEMVRTCRAELREDTPEGRTYCWIDTGCWVAKATVTVEAFIRHGERGIDRARYCYVTIEGAR